jgi:hypothetical protein
MQRNLRAVLRAFVLANAAGLGAGLSAATGLDLEPAAGCGLLADRRLALVAPRLGFERYSPFAATCSAQGLSSPWGALLSRP